MDGRPRGHEEGVRAAWAHTRAALADAARRRAPEGVQPRRVVFREGTPLADVSGPTEQQGEVRVTGPDDPIEVAGRCAAPPLLAFCAVAASTWALDGGGRRASAPPEADILARTDVWNDRVRAELGDLAIDEAVVCPRVTIGKACGARHYAPLGGGGTLDMLVYPAPAATEEDMRVQMRLILQSAQMLGRTEVVVVAPSSHAPAAVMRTFHAEAVRAVRARGTFRSVTFIVPSPEALREVLGEAPDAPLPPPSLVPPPPPSLVPSPAPRPPSPPADASGGGRAAAARVVFVVRASHADADLEDQMDEWEFEGGLGRAFPPELPPGEDEGTHVSHVSHERPVDAPEHRRPMSALDRRMTLRLLRQQARLLLATLVARRIPGDLPAIEASALLDVPLARFRLIVRALRDGGTLPAPPPPPR